MRSVASHEFIHHLLLELGVETFNVKREEFELLPVSSHFRELPVDVTSLFVGCHICPVFSVVGSTPSPTLSFVVGTPWLHR